MIILEIIVNDITYEVVNDYKEAIDKELLATKITDYFDDFNYIVGDWAYGKLRLNYAYHRNPVSLYRLLRKNGWYANVKKNTYINHNRMIHQYILAKNGNWT